MKDFLLKKMALPTIVLIWAASYYVEVMGYSEKNHKLIQPVFWVIVLLYIINGVTDYREWKASQKDKADQPAQPKEKLSLEALDWNGTGKIVAAIAAMVIYVAMLDILGFVISTLLFVAAILFVMGERRWFLLVGVPTVLDIILYVVFRIALSIPLPTGFLGF